MLRQLKCKNFRNLENLEVILDKKYIVFSGKNGQGKTNILEAIYYLIFSSSFREQREEYICQIGYDNFVVFGEFEAQKFGKTNLGVSWTKDQKKIVLNGTEIRDRKELITNFPCIAFCTSDIFIIDGSMDRKRRFFDQILSFINSSYIDYLRRYRKILKQRNFILKTKQLNLLPIYTEQLIDVGIHIVMERIKCAELFRENIKLLFEKNYYEEVECIYQQNWKNLDKEIILKKFKEKEQQELIYGMTLYGPHRDGYILSCAGRDVSRYFSIGQKRLLALILKSTALEIVYQNCLSKPIILLDDIFGELTHDVRDRFLTNLPSYRQAIFTILPESLENFPFKGALNYVVNDGAVSAI